MKRNLSLLFAFILSVNANLYAQVTIGNTTEPARGALLDLNSENGVKGGLVLSNVEIEDLRNIPNAIASPSGGWTSESKRALTGAMVYNKGTETVPAGIYIWNGCAWTRDGSDDEQILFTILSNDTEYRIPTGGMVNETPHNYSWRVSIDGNPADPYTGSTPNYSNNEYSDDGIRILVTANVPHQIRITPYNCPEAGWGNAFGHLSDGSANTAANKAKLISIDAPLTTMAFAPETGVSTAAYMFGYLFQGCTNLTTPATIKDTYKLPNTITNLSGFLAGIHSGNTSLTASINLAPLSGWFSNNTDISNLSNFLLHTHSGNTSLQTPIDLTPLSGWFSNNTFISNLSNFLVSTHAGNTSLQTPIDLTPLSGWFGNNTSVTYDLSYFINSTHDGNTNLTAPIDFRPLSGWFSSSTSISNLTGFLSFTHRNNNSLKLEGQVIFPDWIKDLKQGSTPILDLSSFNNMFSITSGAAPNDTAEPKFQDGTALSSLGNSSTNRSTYTGRNITPPNTGWK